MAATCRIRLSATASSILLTACLYNHDLYERRLAELTADDQVGPSDEDGDGYTRDQGDCDDQVADTHPGAVEVCDGRDNDCDGDADEQASDSETWYLDADGDGHGDSAATTEACERPAEHVSQGGDCDDRNPAAYPGAEEIPYDGVDQDCDGADIDDLDGDGQAAVEAGGPDCDDEDVEVFDGAEESWTDGFVDNDCDGEVEALSVEIGHFPWTGETAESHFGERLAPLGAIEGASGRQHVLAAAVWTTEVGEAAGAVYAITGSEGGPVSEQLRIDAPDAWWGLGAGIDGGTDVDGDGLPDIAAGATLVDDGAGEAYLFSSADLVGEGALVARDDELLRVTFDEASSFLGAHTEFVGDTDGDGVDEVAVSAPFADVTLQSDAGRIALIPVTERGVVAFDDLDRQWSGPWAEAHIGNRVKSLGDVDGDGLDDLYVSGDHYMVFAVLPGGAASGDLLDDVVTWMYFDREERSPAGQVVGDVDGDGGRDIVLFDTPLRIHTGLGRSTSRSIDEHRATFDNEDGSDFYAAADLGDRDGDGRDETAITIPESSTHGAPWMGILQGSQLGAGVELGFGDLLLQAVSVRPGSFLGQRIINAGDVDEDGVEDMVLGGYRDSEGGSNAGGVVVVPVPR